MTGPGGAVRIPAARRPRRKGAVNVERPQRSQDERR
jgi:hypothetical protein